MMIRSLQLKGRVRLDDLLVDRFKREVSRSVCRKDDQIRTPRPSGGDEHPITPKGGDGASETLTWFQIERTQHVNSQPEKREIFHCEPDRVPECNTDDVHGSPDSGADGLERQMILGLCHRRGALQTCVDRPNSSRVPTRAARVFAIRRISREHVPVDLPLPRHRDDLMETIHQRQVIIHGFFSLTLPLSFRMRSQT